MLNDKGLYNRKYAKWYYRMYLESGGQLRYVDVDGKRKLRPVDNCFTNAYFNRAERIDDCMNLWLWDKYDQNKILDLQRVNRCKNRAFCPNCKKLNVSRFIHDFRGIMPKLLDDYDFYMLTLTVPSVHDDGSGKSLNAFLGLLSKKFQDLNRKFTAPLYTPTGKLSSKALRNRYFVMSGGIRVLEITYNHVHGFHPHLHCLVLVPKGSIDSYLLEDAVKGKFSIKRNSYNYWSLVELQIGKAWSMLWYDISFRFWDKYEFDPSVTYMTCDGESTPYKNLEIDFCPLDDKGIYEIFKYTFKNSDVSNYNVFTSLVRALEHKRLRQGFGLLYNYKCDDDFESGEVQALELEIPEDPEQLLTTEISQLITEYKDYRKISRFNKGDLGDVANHIKD